MNTKAACQRRHAIERALERYEVSLNRDSYEALNKKVQRQEGVFIARQSNRVSLWQVQATNIRGEKVQCNVVYDKSRGQIVTFLPPGAAETLRGITLPSVQEAV